MLYVPFLSLPLFSTQKRRVLTRIAEGWWVVCHYSPPGNVVGVPMAFTNNLGKQISGSPGMGADSTSSFVLPSSPVTVPRTSGNGEVIRSISDPSLEDGAACAVGNVMGMLGLLLAWMVVLLV